MDKLELQDLGFSEGEAEIYLALLKLGSANVMQLAKTTGRHRTHIYDTIEKLKEKGLVSESVIDNKKVFIASDPSNIISYIKEKEEKAQIIISELEKLQKISKKDIKVETYKGKSGLKSVLRDILREKKDYVGYGEGTRFGKILPIFFQQFQNQSNKLGIGLKLILKKGAKVPKREKLQLKYLDYVSPSTTFVYADKIVIIIWEPFPTAIKIIDKQTADSYRSYFEVIWKQAEK
ncbi:TrmB family transcriptional regulator [Candidatus Woesearchaeota archaeon]|nr:TrmB family transcriptional regulator [Candidatus Woesearchaeota archaeon]